MHIAKSTLCVVSMHCTAPGCII